MSNAELDELADAARNRGLKLVRSRVRTPTKRRFGKVGLTDKAGNPVFGMDAKGPIAKPDAVEEYLRSLLAQDWGASLKAPAARQSRKSAKSNRRPESERDPRAKVKPAPPAKPKPKPEVRDARPSDAPGLVALIRYLGHEIDEQSVRKNLSRLKRADETPLVATLDGKLVGLCGIAARVVIHRDAPVGRISPLVVAEDAQGQGIGRMLVEAAEQWMRDKRCKLLEVTSNDRLAEAHAFYRHLGFERTSIRFHKQL